MPNPNLPKTFRVLVAVAGDTIAISGEKLGGRAARQILV